MDSLCRKHIEIIGGMPLFGSQRVHGAKNAVLPILAATLLNRGENFIEDCPDLSDVRETLEILKLLGCKTAYENGTAYVDSSAVTSASIPAEHMKKMRSSVIFLGSLAARCGEAHVCLPGGCALGARPIDLHLSALKKLGMKIETDGLCVHCYASNLQPADIELAFPSVGATENAVLAATAVPGISRIFGAAKEPEIEDLLLFLRGQGARVFTDGQGTITIEGKSPNQTAHHRVIPDRILAATLMAATVVCGGETRLTNVCPDHLTAIRQAFEQTGAKFSLGKRELTVYADGRAKGGIHITTEPYPGFPTDAQSLMIATLLRSEGKSVVTENIFEARFGVLSAFEKMGAKLEIVAKDACVEGVEVLKGADVEATDLRAGAALCVAALGAEGKTRVFETHHIERGYENLPAMLRALGARVHMKG